MSSDDQYFLDLLSSIPNDVKRYSIEVADSIDRHFESISNVIRDSLASSQWIPESARPSIPVKILPPSSPPLSNLERAQGWFLRHKTFSVAVVVSAGLVSYFVYRRRRNRSKKRRARRASNGARREVVAICGNTGDRITRSLYLDLERRGFIVYVIVNTAEDLQLVESESRVDIRPLRLDISDATSSHDAIENFNQFLVSPHRAFPGASPHNIKLVGLIMIPDMNFASGPIETLSPDIWSDALNTKVLATVATTQAFLRILCNFKARLLVLTPGIIPALSPPFHGIESSTVAAIEAFTTSLQGELRPLDVDVCQIHLGSFDCHNIENKHRGHAANSSRADALLWSPDVRAAYAKNFYASGSASGDRGYGNVIGDGVKGSDLRELHNAVFDALTDARPRRTWRVGSGSLAYGLIGKLVPSGVVGWMLGIRRVQPQEDGEEFETTA